MMEQNKVHENDIVMESEIIVNTTQYNNTTNLLGRSSMMTYGKV